MKINPSEPAFPFESSREVDGGGWVNTDGPNGLTKLEWAAVQIMAGLEANPVLDMSSEACAAVAVRRARALFAELEKGE